MSPTWLPALLAGLALAAAARPAWAASLEGGRRLAVLAAAVAVWCLAAAAAGLAGGPGEGLAWARLGAVGLAVAGPAWTCFALRYAGVRPPRALEVAIAAPAAAAILVAWSPWAVPLVWDAGGGAGPGWRWGVVPYVSITVALGAAAAAVGWARARGRGRPRAAAPLLAVALPVAVAGLSAPAEVVAAGGPVPVAAAVATLGLVALVAGRRSFGALPLAHRLVFDSLADAQIVLDRFGRVADLNPAAERLLDLPLTRAGGQALSALAPGLAREATDDEPHEVRERGRVLSVRTRPLRRDGERLVSVRDVTEAAHAREVVTRRGLLLEAVDALTAAPDPQPAAALDDLLERVARALDLRGAALLVDRGEGAAYDVRAAWHDGGRAAWHGGGAYAAEGLGPVRDAIRRGHTTLVAAPGADGPRVALPLRVGGRDWGALVLEGGDRDVLRDLGDALAGVVRALSSSLERERAEAERRHGDRFREGLQELTRELLTGDPGEDPHGRALRAAAQALGADAGSLFVRRGGGRLVCVAALGARPAPRTGDALGEPTASAAASAGVSLLRGPDAAAGEGGGACASLVAPVTLRGRLEAVLRLDHLRRPDAFGDREAAALGAFAGQVGAVLQRLDLQARAEAAAAAGRLVAEADRLLATASDVRTVPASLAPLVLPFAPASLAAVALVHRGDDGGLAADVRGPRGRDGAAEDALLAGDAQEALGALLDASDPVARPRLAGPPWERAGLAGRALLAVPLRRGGAAWGALLWFVTDERALTEARALLTRIASAVDLAQARQEEREARERRLRHMQALVRTGEALRTATDRAEVIERTLAAVLRDTRADGCALLLLDRERDRLRVAGSLRAWGRAEGPVDGEVSTSDGPAARVLAEGRSLALHDPVGVPGPWRVPPASLMGTPLRNADGEAVGVLLATGAPPATPFGDDEVGLLEALAQACGTTLVRLGLLERVRRQADDYREAWERAQRGEARFRSLAENVSDTVCLHDARGRLAYVSPSIEGLLGHRAEDLAGSDPLALVLDEDRAALRDTLVRPLALGVPVHGVTMRLRHRDGQEVWVETHAQPIQDAEGRVTGMVSTSRDVTERKRLEKRLLHGALYDDLTGLPNRALLMDRLQHALHRARRQERRFALLFLDLDRFKLVNDSLGHHAGDELLAAIAGRVAGCVRDADTVARLGGDEFCVLLENVADDEVVLRTAERIQAALTQRFEIGETDVFTSASIGIAFSHPDYDEPGELLRDADVAMYRAKAAGKARHEVFARGMRAGVADRLAVETALHRAIEGGELRLAFQPVVEVASGEVAGVEALVRWAHPERGLLPPAEFVPLAEESGLIVELDRWVLGHACRQLRAWEERFEEARRWTVSVNLSPMHFALDDAAGTLLGVVEAAGLDPARVRVEITESALQGRGDAVATVLTSLRARGVTVGIDDFGTGYSSLRSLQHLPIDALKVDAGFVRRMVQDERQRDLVETILSLARGLGIAAVAEGVEAQGQLDALRGMGCAYAQGWLWSEAAEADAFARRWLGVAAPGA